METTTNNAKICYHLRQKIYGFPFSRDVVYCRGEMKVSNRRKSEKTLGVRYSVVRRHGVSLVFSPLDYEVLHELGPTFNHES